MILATLQRIHTGPLDRRQWQNHIILTDTTIVDHAAERALVPALLRLLAVLVDRPHHDVIAPVVTIPSGFICEAEHLPRFGVELWMRGECRSKDLAFKIISPDRLQGYRVHDIGRPIFLAGEQHASPECDVGVRRRAHHALDGFIVREWIPIPPKQSPLRRSLLLIPICPHIPLFEVRMPVFDTDCCDAAIAVEVDVVFEDGRKAVIRLDAVKCAIDLGRDCAAVFEVVDVAFDAGRFVEALEDGCFWVCDGCC